MTGCGPWRGRTEPHLARTKEALPPAHAARVDMDEATWIITYAAALQRERRDADQTERPAGQANVDRAAIHVQAVRSNSLALGMKHCVGDW